MDGRRPDTQLVMGDKLLVAHIPGGEEEQLSQKWPQKIILIDDNPVIEDFVHVSFKKPGIIS